MRRSKLLKFFLETGILLVLSIGCFADNNKDINRELMVAMTTYHVPVVGYAIIKDYKIVAAQTLSIDPKFHASNNSLFQAASISKSISAYGALKLVSQGKLNLDKPVNDFLTTWKIPENTYNKNHPVTLRQMLDMTSGLSVSGFPGYSQGEALPTLNAILDGKPPANTPPIEVFYEPGTKYFYSGGAFQVLEKLIEDATNQPFQRWMENEILKPLNMNNSTFQCPLSNELSTVAVPGFLHDGKRINGGWNNYPIASAGGAWSTPTDIAKFVISMSNAYLGKENNLVSKPVATQMLSRQKNTDYGLGVVINGSGRNLNFRKAGHNVGYHNQMLMFPNSGDGVVIMTNSENGEYVINYIVSLIALKYRWPCYFPYFDELIVIPQGTCKNENLDYAVAASRLHF